MDIMEIKAIETLYKGFRFRSRLEARWAVFFDAIGIKWEYEVEGLDIDGVWYLPDFKIGNKFVEIKPSDASLSDIEKPIALAKAGKNVVVLQGNPWIDEYFAWVTRGATCEECFNSFGNELVAWPTAQIGVCLKCGETGIYLLSRDRRELFGSLRFGRAGKINCGCAINTFLKKAYQSARQARFEFGEKPEIEIEASLKRFCHASL
jgi:hypothetical protein